MVPVMALEAEHGASQSGEIHDTTMPARRRSSLTGAVGYTIPPAEPIAQPKPRISWRPTFKRLESGVPLVLNSGSNEGPSAGPMEGRS